MDRFFEIEWTRNRLNRAWRFMKLLRVEPYLFLVMFQMSLKGTPSSQLLQDKICMNWYNTTAQYCRDLPTLKEDGDSPGHYKNRILADVAQFGTYSTYLTTIPGLVWALFVGAWIDRYVKGRKLLMLFSVGSAIIENLTTIYLSISFDTSVYYNLLLHIPTSIFGGHIAARIAITHYMSSTTPPKLMAIRFMIFEMCMSVASPIGSSLGGYILVRDPLFHTGEIRNYTLCFIIALAFELLAFLWIFFMVNEKVARKHEMRIEMKLQGIKNKVDKDGKAIRVKLRSDMSREDRDVHPIRLLFDLGNIKTMVMTVIKDRPNKGRKQLITMLVSMIIMFMTFSGAMHLSSQFIQRVYRWAPDWQSYMNSISSVVHTLATISIVPILIRVIKIHDAQLAIIGYCTSYVTNLIKGIWLSPIAFYVCIPISSISGIASIGTRSHLTKIVGRDEIGKVMSFMSTLDTVAPIISSTVFTYIFKYTIDTYPGTIFQVTAMMTLVPILVMMWIDLYTERPLGERKGDEEMGKEGDCEEREMANEKGLHKSRHGHHHGHFKRHHHHHHKQRDNELNDKEKNEHVDMTGYESGNDNKVTTSKL